MTIQKIGNLLEGAIKRAGIQQKLTAAQIIQDFKNIAVETWGRQVLERVKPRYLRGGVLTIQVKDSVYAAELKLKEKKIVKIINSKYNKAAIKSLRFQIR
ncbi:MAG: hypothetical protein COT24_01620 [Candidatus Kerfeldbacteria bacterium CG08_land_8_20_14_0_20_40_16]|uniref:DUF721 domain-containing protein n=1 Tax=Candidatus Kerfeldbacteria bacterium CG08_land_8_20_14_0_20_40_16 TaxID=2014244 RepID=A0A2H0YWF1_9BACT|nr:MAG: hypothetical protein COT24_01620 [Candidatus Kerfeldbacteria bacterium CG08_land_8_20_14_0_20_40_16]